jgi:hypothetical protein
MHWRRLWLTNAEQEVTRCCIVKVLSEVKRESLGPGHVCIDSQRRLAGSSKLLTRSGILRPPTRPSSWTLPPISLYSSRRINPEGTRTGAATKTSSSKADGAGIRRAGSRASSASSKSAAGPDFGRCSSPGRRRGRACGGRAAKVTLSESGRNWKVYCIS